MATLARNLAVNQLASALEELIRAAVREGVETAVAGVLAELPATEADRTALLSATEVARRLEVSPDYARKLLDEQDIHPIKVGSERRYSAAEVGAWLSGLLEEERAKWRASARSIGIQREGVTIIESRRRRKKPVAVETRRAKG